MTGTAGATLLFGGYDFGSTTPKLLGDTWAWDGEHWQQWQDMGPSPRWGPAMSWDAARSRGVLFGGLTVAAGGATFFGDTWESFTAP
jgi:hypothetical protein